MTYEETAAWVGRLIATDQLHRFYTSAAWLRLRAEVLAESHGECQWCKARGFYVPAVVVHHQKHVRDFPGYALSKEYTVDGATYQNLVPLCVPCHESAHNRKLSGPAAPPLTEERW